MEKSDGTEERKTVGAAEKSECTGKVAGFSKAKEFQEYREAAIAQKFNLDEVDQRILNADGASWIKKVKDMIPTSTERNNISVAEPMRLSVGSFLLTIPNGTDPQLLAQTLHIMKELEC